MNANALSFSRYNPLVDGGMPGTSPTNDTYPRSAWMRLLALSGWQEIEHCAGKFRFVPHEVLRAPEIGLVMLRGRMGATGAAFNLGEASVTRCAVKLEDGLEGYAHILGRNTEHARTAAICDALLQKPEEHQRLREQVLVPLEQKLRERHMTMAGKAAATKVDFFTMVRGDV